MSSNQSTSTSSSSSFQSSSFSSFSSNINGRQTSYSERTHTDPSGTTIHRTTQEPGQQPTEERVHHPAGGNRVEGAGEAKGRIEDVTDTEKDREYEERMEEEYAKREGGA